MDQALAADTATRMVRSAREPVNSDPYSTPSDGHTPTCSSDTPEVLMTSAVPAPRQASRIVRCGLAVSSRSVARAEVCIWRDWPSLTIYRVVMNICGSSEGLLLAESGAQHGGAARARQAGHRVR